MTLEEGIIMAIVLNGIVLPLLIFAYYKGFKDYDDKKRKEEEDAKKPKPW